jgi:hypothetical protein
MQMIRQNHPSINVKRPTFTGMLNKLSKRIDMPNQQVVGMTFQQIGGKKISRARYTVTAIVGHK